MATLSTTRNYADGEVLVEADLDAFLDDLETFINVTKINDDNIQDSGITASTKLLNASVNSAKLATDSVTTVKIADSNVTTAKIADSNVTTAKIADLNVTTGKINDLAVTTGKINTSAVTTAKINDGAVTRAKLNTYYISYSSGTPDTYSWSNGSPLDQSVSLGTLTTNGRPVLVIISLGSGTASNHLGTGGLGTGTHDISLRLARNTDGGGAADVTYFANTISTAFSSGNVVSLIEGRSAAEMIHPTSSGSATAYSTHKFGHAGAITFLDTPAAGAHEYLLRFVGSGNANGSWVAHGVNVIVFEL